MANSGIVDLAHDEDDFERDMKEAIAASLEIQSRLPAGITQPPSDIRDDDDDELQQVLALSMQTYEAEQHQHRPSETHQLAASGPTQQQHPQSQQQQQLNPMQQQLQARKRSNSMPAASPAVTPPGEAADTGPHKRQRSSPSPAAASNQVSQCGEVDPTDDQDTSSSKHGQPQQHMQPLRLLPQQQQQVMSQFVVQAAAQMLVNLSHSAALHGSAVCGSVTGNALPAQQPQVQQQQRNQVMAAGLRRSQPSQHLATLATDSGMQQSEQQQPPGQQQQYQRQITPGDYEAGSGDWDDNLSDLSDPLADPQASTQPMAGSGSNAGNPQQQQQPQAGQQIDGSLQDQQQKDDQQRWEIPLYKLPHIGEHLIYQLHDPVYWIDPYSRLAYTGRICGTEPRAGASCYGRSYVVDLQDALVRYVAASCEQLLHRIEVGDAVWCKPNIAISAAWSGRTALTHEQQRTLQQALRQRPGPHTQANVWLGSPWLQGCVVNTEVHQGCVPVVEVSLPCGGQCWFPVWALQLVKDTGESSTMAANKGMRPAAPAAVQVDDDVVVVGSAAGVVGAAAGHDDLADTAAAPAATAVHIQQPGEDPATVMQLDPQALPADSAAQQQQQQQVDAGETEQPAVAVAANVGAAQMSRVSGLAPVTQTDSQRPVDPQQQHTLCSLRESGRCGGLLSGCRCAGEQRMQQPCGVEGRHEACNGNGVTAAAGPAQL